MIQEITNGTWKMDQAMKRKRIFFFKELRQARGGQRNRRREKNTSDKPVGLNSHADR